MKLPQRRDPHPPPLVGLAGLWAGGRVSCAGYVQLDKAWPPEHIVPPFSRRQDTRCDSDPAPRQTFPLPHHHHYQYHLFWEGKMWLYFRELKYHHRLHSGDLLQDGIWHLVILSDFSSFAACPSAQGGKTWLCSPRSGSGCPGWRAAVVLLFPWRQQGTREGDVAVFHTSASILEWQSGFYSSRAHSHVP